MMTTFKCTPIKDKDGLIDINKTEIYNTQDERERYVTGFNQWRIGEIIKEEDILFNKDKVAYNKNLVYF